MQYQQELVKDTVWGISNSQDGGDTRRPMLRIEEALMSGGVCSGLKRHYRHVFSGASGLF